MFAETFTLVTPDTLDPPACRDRVDDVVLATAVAGECAATITGDEDLLILNGCGSFTFTDFQGFL